MAQVPAIEIPVVVQTEFVDQYDQCPIAWVRDRAQRCYAHGRMYDEMANHMSLIETSDLYADGVREARELVDRAEEAQTLVDAEYDDEPATKDNAGD